jgi:hypothetical protein
MTLFYCLRIMSSVVTVRSVHMCKSDRFKIESVSEMPVYWRVVFFHRYFLITQTRVSLKFEGT